MDLAKSIFIHMMVGPFSIYTIQLMLTPFQIKQHYYPKRELKTGPPNELICTTEKKRWHGEQQSVNKNVGIWWQAMVPWRRINRIGCLEKNESTRPSLFALRLGTEVIAGKRVRRAFPSLGFPLYIIGERRQAIYFDDYLFALKISNKLLIKKKLPIK